MAKGLDKHKRNTLREVQLWFNRCMSLTGLEKSDRSSIEQQVEIEALFDSIGEGAITTDEFGIITRANPTACKLLGYPQKDLIGEVFVKQLVATNLEDQPINLIDRPITRAFLTGEPVYQKMYYRTKSGKNLPVAVTVSPVFIDDKPLGAIEVFRDISREHEIDRMKSEFISLASHQLRTPLSAIKTYTHMLYDGFMGDLSDSQKKSLSTIISATDRMNELISTLLNVTRIEGGTIAITKKIADVNKIAEEVVEELALNAATKSIQVQLKCDPSTSNKIKTDVLIFKEILSNLVSNSIKYTPDKGKVTIKITRREKDVLFSVKDNGWGIPKNNQEQIFGKFFRAQNIVKQETTGTGLGLYLVKGLVEALGGEIWFKSQEHKGTTFYFYLPIK